MATSRCKYGGSMMFQNEFPFDVKLCGGIYHSIPPIITKDYIGPKFVQCYVVESTDKQIKQRIKCDLSLNKAKK
jgi:hypothetical protein